MSKMRVVNNETYATPHHRVRKLTVEFICDPVPGAWHEPIDLMEWIAKHSYVKEVILEE